jgi:hypothetical protein
MTSQTPISAADWPLKAPHMRPALRHAVSLIVDEGRSQREAAARSGLNEKSLSRALQRPAIAAYVEQQKALAVMDADKLKASARRMAIRVGIQLLHDAKSEQVRARMVEFFAGEGRQSPQINVQINNDRGGYEFVRPGSRLVEISPPPDTVSGGEEAQAPDNNNKSDDLAT